MERLTITSKVLYDKDLLDKKKEIDELKSEILEQTIPKILYDDYEEWDKLKIEAIKICQEGVRNFISVEEYPFMRDFGFTPNQQMDGLYMILWKAFNKITKGQSNECPKFLMFDISIIIDVPITLLQNIYIIVLDTLSYLINTTSFDITPFRIHTLTYVISPGHSPSHIQIRNFACTYG